MSIQVKCTWGNLEFDSENIDTLGIQSEGGCVSLVLGMNGMLISRFTLPYQPRVKLSFNGTVAEAMISNCGLIIGNVNSATVGNCATIEGKVNPNACKAVNRVEVNESLKVYVNEMARDFASGMRAPYFTSQPQTPTKTIGVSGNLRMLSVQANVITVIRGNVKKVDCNNCLDVKGNVKEIQAGNTIYTSNGVSKGIPEKEYIAQCKKRLAEAQSQKEATKMDFTDMFDGAFSNQMFRK